MSKPFIVGEGNRALAQISDGAAALLELANEAGILGVELGNLYYLAAAGELVEEDMGIRVTECRTHGMLGCPGDNGCADTWSVLIATQAGVNWLVDSGRVAD